MSVQQMTVDRMRKRNGALIIFASSELGEEQVFEFRAVTDQLADRVVGDLPDRPSVVPVSSAFNRPLSCHSPTKTADIPIVVLDAVADEGYQVVTNISCGWSSWGGFPSAEDSITRADVSDFEVHWTPEPEDDEQAILRLHRQIKDRVVSVHDRDTLESVLNQLEDAPTEHFTDE